MNSEYKGEKFLNRLYKDLHMSEEVMHTAIPSDSKDEKVHKYLERLEKVGNMARESKYNGMKHLKNLYYRKYVIKPENVPESYFELQKKIALERGFGHVDIDNQTKEEMINAIIEEQKKSLDIWLDYLISQDAMYPEWFKYYAFQGMLKLGSYDKEKSIFNKRTGSTTNMFVDLNYEALALTYDNLCNILEGNSIDDESLQKLIENGSFAKIYGYLIKKLDSENKELLDNNDGIWVKYDRGSKPDELVNSLQGKGTGWCTAGYETSKQQLEGGDFHVYYTKDKEGNYSQPRIAIRMEDKKIGEIRGIAEHQNMESEMEVILNKKLDEFPDKEEYMKKVHDMKLLTKIYKEHKDRQLTKEEIRFLYEVDDKILGFGYRKDPRIKEILDGRSLKKDLSFVFDCTEDEISNNKKDVLDGKKIVYFYGNLLLFELTSIEGLVLPKIIDGDLSLSFVKSIKEMVFPESVSGDLDLYNLTSAEGLVLPRIVGGILDLSSLEIVEGLTLPQHVGGLFLSKLQSAEGLILPKSIDGDLKLDDLENIGDLVLPERIGGDLILSSLTSVQDLTLPEEVDRDLNLISLVSAENLMLPKIVGRDLDLGNLTSSKNLTLPQSIGGYLDLFSLKSLDDLIVPNDFTCECLFSEYISKEDLVNKSLEETQIDENYKRMGFSNVYILVLFAYVSSLILTLIGFLILK